jgi:hypothetical protein
MPDVTMTVDVTGAHGLLAKVRGEVAQIIRDAAAKESPAVSARLFEVAAAIAQGLSYDEAVKRMATAKEHTGLPHRGPSPPVKP